MFPIPLVQFTLPDEMSLLEEQRSGYREILEEFIQAYRNEPCLWQTKFKDYHDRNKKDAAYMKLIKIYKQIDPRADRNAVVKKINNLRSTYRKEFRKIKKYEKAGEPISELTYTPRLWYFHLLDFLYEEHEIKSNVSEDENEEEDQPAEPKEEKRETPEFSYVEADPIPELSMEPSILSFNESDNERYPRDRFRPIIKRSNTLTDDDVLKIFNDHFKRPRNVDDRFDIYGKYVGIKLRELPKRQRILAEKIINETLFLAEMGSLTMTHAVKNSDS